MKIEKWHLKLKLIYRKDLITQNTNPNPGFKDHRRCLEMVKKSPSKSFYLIHWFLCDNRLRLQCHRVFIECHRRVNCPFYSYQKSKMRFIKIFHAICENIGFIAKPNAQRGTVCFFPRTFEKSDREKNSDNNLKLKW